MKYSRLLIFAIGFLVLQFFPLLFGKTFLFGDNYSLMVPGKLFTALWLKEGVLPLWNPLLFAGISWIGDINQTIFYPSTLLFLVFSPATALNVTILAHVFFTFVGVYVLAKRLKLSEAAAYFVAILWSCSPHVVSSINNIATLQSLSFLPWIVWAGVASRKSILFSILLGLLVAFQMLGGYPQYILYSLALSFVLNMTWPWDAQFIRSWLLAGAIAVGASAFVWMPFLSTLENSTRMVQSADQAASGSLLFGELVHVILPIFFNNPEAGMRWGFLWNAQPNTVMYFGWFGLLLLGFGLRNFRKAPHFIRMLWLVFVASLLFAFGDALPWFSFLKELPILGASRNVSGILQLTGLAGALIIGWSFDQLKPKMSLRWRNILWSTAVFTALATIGWFVVVSDFSPIWQKVDHLLSGRLSLSVFHTLERDKLIIENILRMVAITSALLALSLFFWQRKKYTFLLACVALDVVFSTSHLFFFAPKEIYATDPSQNEITTLMRDQDLSQYRILTRNYNTPYTDFGAYWDSLAVRSPFSDSYIDATELKTYSHLRRMRGGATPDWNLVFNIPVINGYTTLLPLDVYKRFAASDSFEASINSLPEIALNNQNLSEWSVGYYVRDTWFPLYDDILPEQVLAQTENLTLYELPAKPRVRWLSGELTPINDFHETPNELSFSANVSQPAELIIADRYDKDWRATSNNKEVEIHNHNGMRRIELAKGEKNYVRMWYEPRAFYYGVIVSFITLGSASLYLFLEQRKV